jgi:EPS-associated MarR family transcriptional regulator
VAQNLDDMDIDALDDRDTALLRALAEHPELSQRDLARRTGASLGAVNYCLRALAEKGLVKARNFRAADNKLRYAYLLTPQGIEAKTRLTLRFLQRKRAEYARLQAEIAALEAEVAARHGDEDDKTAE